MDEWRKERYDHPVKEKTVYLPDDVSADLERLAEAEGRSESELVREGLRYVMELHAPAEQPPIPLFMSDDPTLAERVDDLLRGFGNS